METKQETQMLVVYLLWEEHRDKCCGRVLGAYSTHDKAMEARQRQEEWASLRTNCYSYHITEEEMDSELVG
jgi:hypothetical protein